MTICDSCDVILTAQMDSVWTAAAAAANFNVDLSYIATRSGVVRVYPGINLSALFDDPQRYEMRGISTRKRR